MSAIIETNALTKKYGKKLAVNKISLHLKKGEIYGLIGKNGAGKTTLMKLLLGLTCADQGTISLFGSNDLNSARKKIGSLVETPALYKNASAFENMKRFAILSPTTDEEIRALLELVGLADTGSKKAGEFSLGMRQRLGIAVALLGKPEVLILDEPINGLDPAGIKEIRDLILKLNQQGVTILISSHLLDELGKIATTFGIMSDGVMVEEISAEELRGKCKTSLYITTNNCQKATEVLKRAYPDLQVEGSGNRLSIPIFGIDVSKVNRLLVEADVGVYELVCQGVGLEEYFIERMGK